MFYKEINGCGFPSSESCDLCLENGAGNQSSYMIPENGCGCFDDDMYPIENVTKEELLRKIQETVFALVDLNEFLDTHPNCNEALELYTSLAFTKKALIREYAEKYGPLMACDSKNTTPFAWVSDKYMWPWQKNKEE